ncbi:unnamed protein product, partial [marine sediment metagenome]
LKHILPNCISPIMVQASMDLGGIILTLAAFKFFRIGCSSPYSGVGFDNQY